MTSVYWRDIGIGKRDIMKGGGILSRGLRHQPGFGNMRIRRVMYPMWSQYRNGGANPAAMKGINEERAL